MNYKNKEIIIALSFGKRNRPFGSSTNHSNLSLAYLVQDIASKKDCPLLIQKEIADCFDTSKFLSLRKGIVSVFEKGDLSTYEIIHSIVKMMERNECHKAIIITHPAYASRIKAILEKKLIEVELPPEIGNIPFDPQSTIWWTRGPLRWWIMEIPLRILYKLKKFI